MSMPLIYLLRYSPRNVTTISIFHQRSVQGFMPDVSKKFILEVMKTSGALARTVDYLAQLETDIIAEIRAIEDFTGIECPELQKLISSLSIRSNSQSCATVV